MACGCSDESCNCVVQGLEDVVVSGSGTAGDPYVVSHTETEFAAVEGDGIEIIPGGDDGHEPEIAVKIDPDSTADVSVSLDGIRVDIPTDDTIVTIAIPVGASMELSYPPIDPTDPTDAPDGFLLENGGLVATVTYANLFAKIGHYWNGGVDPGGGMMRLPDCRGRAAYGPKASEAVGDMDGTPGLQSALDRDHTHTGPSHKHTNSAPSGTLGANDSNQTGVGAGGTQAEWDKIGATTDNATPNLGLFSIEDIVNYNTGTTVDLTSVAVANDGHGHVFTGSAQPDTGLAGTGATGSKDLPHYLKWKIIKY